MKLENKRIIVTGGAQGIGEAIVRAIAREGAQVHSFDLNAEAGIRVAAAATATGPGSVTFRAADISDKGDVDAAFEEAVADLGGSTYSCTLPGCSAVPPPWTSLPSSGTRFTVSTSWAPCSPTRPHTGR
nr:SDR family NAD(P)-dependent oxidoreductase [Cryobacterium aureum]